MLTRHDFVRPLLGALLTLAATACDEPDAAVSRLEERGVTVLAQIEVDDFEYLFTRSASGKIAVSEEGPSEQPSYLAHLALAQRATPLEMLLALDPDGEAPEELRAAHAAATTAAPRALSLPTPSFRSLTQVEPNANCTLASDGAWFDAEWAERDWTWHWYHSGGEGQTDSPQRTTSNFITHACNNTVGPAASFVFSHYLYDRSLAANAQFLIGNETIEQGHRNVIVLANDSGTYQAQAVRADWASGNYKLGVMAP